MSSIDLVPGPRGRPPSLTLFVDDSEAGTAWVEAARQLHDSSLPSATSCMPVPLRVVHVHGKAHASEALGHGGPDAAPQHGLLTDVVVDVEGAWHSVMGVTPGTALLVRPDGHVAWRGSADGSSDARVLAGKLRQLLQAVLAGK